MLTNFRKVLVRSWIECEYESYMDIDLVDVADWAELSGPELVTGDIIRDYLKAGYDQEWAQFVDLTDPRDTMDQRVVEVEILL